MEKGKRIESIDALRGLCVSLMIAYHLLYDLVYYLDAPRWFFRNPLFDILQPVFAGIFILLAGVSSRFSRNNLKRGFIVLAVAIAVSLSTAFIGNTVRFGILHFLGISMLFYGVFGKFLDRHRSWAAPVLYAVLFIAAGAVLDRVNPVEIAWLWPLGLRPAGFFSADYFPLFPWLFLFLLGAWLGGPLRERKFPAPVYTFRCRPLGAVGRKALLLYILHQPLLYGLTMALRALLY